MEVFSAKSRRLNVLGFMDRDCQFHSFVFQDTITSAVVIACIDAFAKSLQKPTSLVIDNASIHTSKEFLAKIEKWKEQTRPLFIFHLILLSLI
jgi:hypothetical protein